MKPAQLRILGGAALALAVVAGVIGAFPATIVLSAWVMALALAVFTAAVFLAGQTPAEPLAETEGETSDRQLREHGIAALAAGVFLLIGLIELVSIPASLGQLAFFGALAIGFIQLYSGVAALLLALLAAGFFTSIRSPSRTPPEGRRRTLAWVSLGVAFAIAISGALVALGLAGLHPQRAIFVFAGSEVALYFFARNWLGWPTFRGVIDWMEHDEHLHRSGSLRRAGNVFLLLAGIAILLAAASAIPALSGPIGIVSVALAAILLLPATGSIGVTRIVESLERGTEGFEEERKKRRMILVASSLTLTGVAAALGV
ncbi:MAG: hypothetical protein ACYDCK_01360, partial [Thermoplasmatota archaeon]